MNSLCSISNPSKPIALPQGVSATHISDLTTLLRSITSWWRSGQPEGLGIQLGQHLLTMVLPEALAKTLYNNMEKETSSACLNVLHLGATPEQKFEIAAELLKLLDQASVETLTSQKTHLLLQAVPIHQLILHLHGMNGSKDEQKVQLFQRFCCLLLQDDEAPRTTQIALLRNLTSRVADTHIQSLSLNLGNTSNSLVRLAISTSDVQWEKYVRSAVGSSPDLEACVHAMRHYPDLQNRIEELLTEVVLPEKPLILAKILNHMYSEDKVFATYLWSKIHPLFVEKLGGLTIYRPNTEGNFLSDDLSYWQMPTVLASHSSEQVLEIIKQKELGGTKLTQATILISAIRAHPEHMRDFLDAVEERCERFELGQLLGFIVHPIYNFEKELHAQVMQEILPQLISSETALSAFLQQLIELRGECASPAYMNPHLLQFFLHASEPLRKGGLALLEEAINTDHSGIGQVLSALLCSPHYSTAEPYLIKTLERHKSSISVSIAFEQAHRNQPEHVIQVLTRLLDSRKCADDHLEALLQWASPTILKLVLQFMPEKRWVAASTWLIKQVTFESSDNKQKETAAEIGLGPLYSILQRQQLMQFLETLSAQEFAYLLSAQKVPLKALQTLDAYFAAHTHVNEAANKRKALDVYFNENSVNERAEAALSTAFTTPIIDHNTGNTAPVARRAAQPNYAVNEAVRTLLTECAIEPIDLKNIGLNWSQAVSKLAVIAKDIPHPSQNSSSDITTFKTAVLDRLRQYLQSRHISLERSSVLGFLQGRAYLSSSM